MFGGLSEVHYVDFLLLFFVFYGDLFNHLA
jgi:hypothetical protein